MNICGDISQCMDEQHWNFQEMYSVFKLGISLKFQHNFLINHWNIDKSYNIKCL